MVLLHSKQAKSLENLVKKDQEIIQSFLGSPTSREEIILFLYRDSGWRPLVISHVLSESGNVDDGEFVFQEALISLDRKIREGQNSKTSSLKTQFINIAKQYWRHYKKPEVKESTNPEENIIAGNIRNQFKKILAEHEIKPEKPPFFSKYAWILWSILIGVVVIVSYYLIDRNDSLNLSNHAVEKQESSTANKTQDSLQNTKSNKTKQGVLKPDKGISPISPQRKAKLHALAKEFYKGPDLEAFKNDNSNPDDPITKAQKAWTDHDLKKVISILEAIDEKNPRYIYSQLLLGHAYFQTKDYQKAKYSFNIVKQKNIMPYSEEAEWNILITLVAQHKVRSPYFKRHLDKFINDTGNTYNIQAIALGQRMK